MPEPTAEARETAATLAVELLALDINARKAGTSIVDLLANLAKASLGVDVRPTAEDIEAVAPAAPAETGEPAPGEPAPGEPAPGEPVGNA